MLKQHCSPEAVERLTSIVKAEHAQVCITACRSLQGLNDSLASPLRA